MNFLAQIVNRKNISILAYSIAFFYLVYYYVWVSITYVQHVQYHGRFPGFKINIFQCEIKINIDLMKMNLKNLILEAPKIPTMIFREVDISK